MKLKINHRIIKSKFTQKTLEQRFKSNDTLSREQTHAAWGIPITHKVWPVRSNNNNFISVKSSNQQLSLFFN